MEKRPQPGEATDDRRLLRLAGLALVAAVGILGVVFPPREGLSPVYLATMAGLLAGLLVGEQTAPPTQARLWRRLVWLGIETALCFLVVLVSGSVVRPSLIYLLPTSRALLMFGERRGLAFSLTVWLAYGVNVGMYTWPNRLGEYPSYLSFFLAPYVVAVMLTLVTLRQAADRRHVQALYDELRIAHEQLRALHEQARETAIAQERNRLAREIHDTLAHYLTVINVQLEAAEKLAPDQPERALDQVRRARRLAVECLQEVRRSVAALRASTLEDLSLPRALRQLAAEFAESTGIAVRLDLNVPEGLRLAPETALALYRVAQEGLTNVHRHARATTVDLSVGTRHGNVELAVQDDGIGPADAQAGERGGFGLLGLRERVELLGGQLAFGRAASDGSRLAVILPMGEPR